MSKQASRNRKRWMFVLVMSWLLLLPGIGLLSLSSARPGEASTAVAAPSAPDNTCVTLQPTKNNLADSYIQQDKPSENRGGDSELRVKNESGKDYRSLLRFDLSSLPANVVIDSANLGLFVKSVSENVTVRAHALTGAWSENTVTWTTPWTTAGGNFNPTALASNALSKGTKDVYTSWDVKSAVGGWLQNPASNNGVILVASAASPHSEVKFASNDESSASKHPKLEVCYSSGVSLTPDNSGQTTAGGTVVYPHVLTVGNLPAAQTISLAISSSAGFSSAAYVDTNNNGTYQPGTDTPITGPVTRPANSSLPVLIVTQAPAGAPNGTIDVTTITATASPSGIVTRATNTTAVGIPPYTEPVVDGRVDPAYIYNPNSTMQDYCAADGTLLARLFATYDVNDPNYQNVYVVLEMDRRMVDNTYGTNQHPSWTAAGKSHTLGNLDGSDKAEFSFYDGNGNLLFSPVVDYLETGILGSAGITGGEGAEGGLNPIYFEGETSIGYDLQRYCTSSSSCTVSGVNLLSTSPAIDVNYNPTNPAFSDWQFSYLYEISVSKQAFGAAGFGSVSIPYTHVSPNKLGNNEIPAEPCTGNIGDRVWNDRNRDGVQDPTEPGLAGVQVVLYRDNGNGIFDPATDLPQGVRTTDSNGNYLFTGLGPDKYFVDVVNNTVPAGYQLTTNNDPFGPINLASGQSFLQADFGYASSAKVAVSKVQTTADPVIVGGEVVYTIRITNTGQTAIDILPLQDIYDPAYLSFVSANPPASGAGAGVITWNDLTTTFGNLAPNQAVNVEVRFLALAPIGGSAVQSAPTAPETAAPQSGAPDLGDLLSQAGAALNGFAPTAATSTMCTGPLTGNYYPDCKCGPKPDRLTVRYNGPGPTTITIGGNGSGGPFTNVNTGDVFTVVVSGNEPTFTATGQTAQAIHTSCSSPLYPGWTSRPAGSDKFQSGGPFEVVSFSYQGTLFPLIDPATCGVGTLGNRVIIGSAVPDNGSEPGIANVTVNLYGGECPTDPSKLTTASRLRTTTTNANGVYTFSGLMPGEYCVSADNATVPTQYAVATANPLSAASNRDVVNTCDIGYRLVGTGRIGDRVFFDADGSGLPDGGSEPGINGVTVILRRNGVEVDRKVTSGNGSYLFENLAAGTYVVDVDQTTLPAGLTSTTNNDPLTVNLADGQQFLTADFGYRLTRPNLTCDVALVSGAKDVNQDVAATVLDEACTEVLRPAAIGNYVWVDENADGYQDAGEPGLPNVAVELFDAGGSLVDRQITDANGGYLFTGLRPGTYTVQVDPATLPAGATQTTNPINPGADFGNQTQPYSVTVAAGQENLTADFGYDWGNPNGNDDEGAIGDYVWVDADGDGVQDPGEPGLGGVTVTIYYDSNNDGVVDPNTDSPFPGAIDQNGNPGGVTTTDPDGRYIFSDLPPGQYVVVVTPPTGYTQTGDPDQPGQTATNPDNRTTTPIVLDPGDVYLNADFGYRPTPNNQSNNNTIGDRVWLDTNANGAQDAGERGIPRVTVALKDVNGEVIATDTTDAQGDYLFPGLPDGTYTVEVTDTDNVLSELRQSGDPDATLDGMSTVVNLGVGNPNPVANLNQDFGYTPRGNLPGKGVIGDTIFLNPNGNATQDAGEPGIEGVLVYLHTDVDGDGVVDPEDTQIAATRTDENGVYLFGGLDPNGRYIVRVPNSNFNPGGVLEGLTNTADPNGGNDNRSGVTLTPANPINLLQDFGYTPASPAQTRRIGNLVWLDPNANGIYEPALGETPIGGVTVDLYRDLNDNGRIDPGEPLMGTTTTAATINAGSFGVNGNYIFTGLPADRYVVDVTDVNGVLNGYWQSLGNQTADDNSKIDPYAVDATAADRLGADFGYYRTPASIGNFVWEDRNGNGLQDPGEPGIPGVPVTLTITYPNGDVTTLTTTTDSNGAYTFGNLLLDEDYDGVGPNEPIFKVTSGIPAGFNPTLINVGANDAIDSDDPINGEIANPVMGGADNTNDFGFIRPVLIGAIGNYVWVDENADGRQDAGEPGIPNVTIELRDSGGVLLAMQRTDSQGGYLFPNLGAGTYVVRVDQTSLPVGLSWTGPHAGQVPGADFGNQNPNGYSITLPAGAENLTADFGYDWGNPNGNDDEGAIGDYVWVDADGDGVQDPGEPGLGGVTVTIYYDSNNDGVVDPNTDSPFPGAVDQNGNPGGVTTTDPDGRYIFSDLPPGQYVVVVTPPTGYTQTGDPDQPGQTATNPDNRTTTPIVLDPGDVYLNADFGYRPDANNQSNNNSIGDRVWLDTNANGAQDAGERGIPGVTLALLNSTGDVIATDTTDAQGNYLFPGLPDGTYTVKVTDTNNVLGELRQSGDPDATLDGMSTVVNLGVGNPNPVANLDQDFGYTPRGNDPGKGVIGDTIFLNPNGNATQDAGEPGVEGVLVKLFDSTGTVLLATTKTDENGNYFFGGLDPNNKTYRVVVDAANFAPGGVLEGLANTADPDGGNNNRSDVTLTPANPINLLQDFGYTPASPAQTRRIGNLVWLDPNANGVYEPALGETPIGGVTVDLYRDLNDNGAIDPGEPLMGTTTTAATINAGSFGVNGNYIFTGLPADRYVVDVTDVNGVLNGYWQSLGNQTADDNSKVDPYAVDATAADRLGADFGYYRAPGSVGDFVWEDRNNNGLQDPGENGIAGVKVTLTITYPSGDVTVLTTTTDSNGGYTFGNLLLDEDYDGVGPNEPVFKVTTTVPAGFNPTLINVGANDAIDSDDPINGEIANPIQGGADNTNDFGFVGPRLGSIGNYVWVDENADGYQDAGEPGISNVTVELRDAGGALLTTQRTDAQGGYLFPNLQPATYIVTVDQTTLPTGLNWTGPHAGQVPGADFGNQNPTGYSITLPEGAENLTADFGFVWGNPNDDDDEGAIGDRIWLDGNGDGIQQPEEVGIPGVLVVLRSAGPDGLFGTADDVPVTSQLTDQTGFYIFDNLQPGAYQVVVDPSNFLPGTGVLRNTQQTGDPDDYGKLATNPDNRTTQPVILAPGDVYLNADFGYRPTDQNTLGSIGNTVWFDADADGIGPANVNGDGSNGAPGTPDNNEKGIPGVSVSLVRDLNGNGRWDAGEPIVATDVTNALGQYGFPSLPLGSYLVWVDDTDNVLAVYQSTYDADGLTNPTAGVKTGAGISAVTLTPAARNNTAQDFGYTAEGHTSGKGLIGDTIWLNINGNTIQESNEPGIEGVIVKLFDASGTTLLATTTTDENGNYYFGGVDPNNKIYRVVVDAANFAPGGALQGLSNSADPDGVFDNGANATLTPASPIDLTRDFGYTPPTTASTRRIGNLVWLDVNANGIYEPALGETPIGGVTVALYRDLNGNGAVDAGDPLFGKTTTSATVNGGSFGVDGNYLFTGLPAGRYVVDVTDEAGVLSGYWHSLGNQALTSDGASKTDPYAVDATAQDRLTADFGYFVAGGALGNRVFNDLDRDGIQDPGEPGIPGIEVTLVINYPNGDTTVVKTVTDNNGAYSFGNLLIDEDHGDGVNEPTYTISTVVPPNFVASPSNVGANDKIDSDDPNGVPAQPQRGATDMSPQPDPNNEPNAASYDFGLAGFMSIGNQIWLDKFPTGSNPDGTFNPAVDQGVSGVKVELFRDLDRNGILTAADGGPIATVTSDANGRYLFVNLAPGDYIVHLPESNFRDFGTLKGTLPLSNFSGSFFSDPDNDINNDNNGYRLNPPFGVASLAITLTPGGEPVGDGDADANSNLTLDFGFYAQVQTAVGLSGMQAADASVRTGLAALSVLGLALVTVYTLRRRNHPVA